VSQGYGYEQPQSATYHGTEAPHPPGPPPGFLPEAPPERDTGLVHAAPAGAAAAAIPVSEFQGMSLSSPPPVPPHPEISPPVASPVPLQSPPPVVAPEPIPEPVAPEPAIPTPKFLQAIHVDRTKLTYRTPKSTQGANNPSFTKALISAVRGGKSTIVESLLDRGVSPDTGTDENAIIIATMNNDIVTLTLLLAFRGNPDSVDGRGRPALVHGAWGRYDPAKVLLEWGANPNIDTDDWTPLPWALDGNKLEMVQLMMLYGADPNHAGTNGDTPLVYACSKGMDAAVVEAMLLYGSDVNAKSGGGYTPLEASCRYGRPALTSLYLKYGADPDLKGTTLPIVMAVGNAECLSYLLQHDVSVPKDKSILGHAIQSHNVESVSLLLEAGADANEIDEWKETPLWHAVYHKHLDIIEKLLKAGADPNKFNHLDRLPLYGALNKPEIFKVLVAGGADPKLYPGLIEKAAYSNQLAIVRIIVEDAKGNIDECESGGWWALATAVRDNHMEICEYLLAQGANPNYRSKKGNWDPPLWLAVRRPHFIRPLLKAGANPIIMPGILEKATYAGQLEAVQILVEEGHVPIDDSESGGWWALATAVRDGHFDICEYLLAHGANPNHRGVKGDWEPPLWRAFRRPEFIPVLLKAGANPRLLPGIMERATYIGGLEAARVLLEEGHALIDEQEPGGWWALATAIRDGHKEVFLYLLSKGANPNFMGVNNNWESLLARACRRGDQAPEYLRALKAHGADASLCPTILEFATWQDNRVAIDVLLKDFGVDINGVNPNGMTALSTAVRDRRPELVQFLLERGANPNGTGSTHLLAYVAKWEDPKAVQMLLKAGCNPNAATKDGDVPLCVASSAGSVECAKALLAAGADPNGRNGRGSTPLCEASWSGSHEVVQHLIQHGANVDLAHTDGRTPMDIAANRGHDEIVMTIIEKMG
jgi:ankyrin repeat protein